MPHHDSDSAVTQHKVGATPSRQTNRTDRTSRSRRVDWRNGGVHSLRRDSAQAGIVLSGAGVAVLSLGVTARLAPQQPAIQMIAMWVVLIAVLVVVLPRGDFDGLWAWRSVDVLWGVAAGLALRLLQGFSAGEQAFPFSATLAGSHPEGWWWQQAFPSTLGGPILEEFFFRALVVVLVFRLVRRAGGVLVAAVAGVLVSAVAFALWHALTAPLSLSDGVQLGVVGATCGALLLLTGRIWGAVIAHVVYNVSYLVLVVIGTTYR